MSYRFQTFSTNLITILFWLLFIYILIVQFLHSTSVHCPIVSELRFYGSCQCHPCFTKRMFKYLINWKQILLNMWHHVILNFNWIDTLLFWKFYIPNMLQITTFLLHPLPHTRIRIPTHTFQNIWIWLTYVLRKGCG